MQDNNAKVRGKGLREFTREKECDFILIGTITELSCVSRNIFKHIIHFRVLPPYLQGVLSGPPWIAKP